jgi:hypothetical protein
VSFVKAGAVPKLVKILEDHVAGADVDLAVQAMATLGSFAFNSDVG